MLICNSVPKWKLLSHVRFFATPWTIQPMDSPGQNTGVGSLSLLQGIFPTQGSNPGLLHCRQILYQLSHKGSPRYQKQAPNINKMRISFLNDGILWLSLGSSFMMKRQMGAFWYVAGKSIFSSCSVKLCSFPWLQCHNNLARGYNGSQTDAYRDI